MDNIDWNNKIEVLKKVSHDGWALEFASDELKNDKEVVLKAVSNTGWALEFASSKLKNDKEVVMAAVSNYAWALQFASDELINDKEFILTAVSVDDDAFKYTSDELKNDKEVILAAISNEAWALNYVSVESRSDYDIMKEFFILAIETYYYNFEYEFYPVDKLYDCILSEKLKEDLDYIKQIYNYKNYKQVCEYIRRTDKIKKCAYKLPLIDTKFRFI
jgi:CxxC motif-containing protein